MTNQRQTQNSHKQWVVHYTIDQQQQSHRLRTDSSQAKSFRMVSTPSRFCKSLQSLASFAKSLQYDFTSQGRSFTYKINNKGSRTVLLWSTPLDTSAHSEDCPFITTRCDLFDKNEEIHFNTIRHIPNLSSFNNSILCGTLLNAFLKSRNIVSTGMSKSIY